MFFTEDIKFYTVFPLWSQESTAALLQQKPPSTRASHDNCSAQSISTRNALYIDSKHLTFYFGSENVIICSTQNNNQSKIDPGTDWRHRHSITPTFYRFSKQNFLMPYKDGFQTQFLELSINTSIWNANSLHSESGMCYMVSYESSSPLEQDTKDEL
jgi:hypothetical protein